MDTFRVKRPTWIRTGFGSGERSRFFTDFERERDLDDLLRDEPERSRFFGPSASRSVLRRVFSFDFGLSLDFDEALSALLLRERLRLVRLSRRLSLLDDDEDDELELDELELDDLEPELCEDELLSDELK